MQWVNFKEIKEKVSIKDVLVYYDAKGLKEANGKLVGRCPVHGGDNPTAFHVDLEKNIWHCFTGCKRGGNVLDLVACKEGISIRDAALKLQELFLSENDQPVALSNCDGDNPHEKIPAGDSIPAPECVDGRESENPLLSFTLTLAPDHPYLLKERQLSPETIQHFGIGYCHKGTMRGRIAIPVHDHAGQLIAYAGRTIKEDTSPTRPKYKFPKGFHKLLELYNIHRAHEAIGDIGEVILVEGFFDVFRLHQAGYPNTVALMGCAMSLEQEGLLRTSCSKVTLLFDGDEAGRNCAEECLWRLVHDLHVRLVELEDGEQPDNLPTERINQLLG